ncbi:hypothetical protein GW17_00037287 [Ensete ventricosum]|nr:hypothetical protein GW17_00037287 [Ensete ventricosum]
MVVSTYQAANGAGAAAMEELVQQTYEVSNKDDVAVGRIRQDLSQDGTARGVRSRTLGSPPLPTACVLVPVTGALIFVSVCSRWHAPALLAAQPAVLEAPILNARLGAPHLALGLAERCNHANDLAQRHEQRKANKACLRLPEPAMVAWRQEEAKRTRRRAKMQQRGFMTAHSA